MPGGRTRSGGTGSARRSPTTSWCLEEPDERFWVGVDLTRNERFVLIALGSKLTSEVWLLDAADAPLSPPVVVAPRRQGVEYDVEHAGRPAPDHCTTTAPRTSRWPHARSTDPGEWTPLIRTSAGTRLLGVDAFADHVVAVRSPRRR